MIHTKRKKEKREFIMTMKELAWLMPLLFILHDMEEIVLGMSFAIYEELILFVSAHRDRGHAHVIKNRDL